MNSDDKRIKALEAMLREVLDDKPKSVCAEDGMTCPFCLAKYRDDCPINGFRADHHEGCWITRAKKLLDGK